jgi:hypothetical protein
MSLRTAFAAALRLHPVRTIRPIVAEASELKRKIADLSGSRGKGLLTTTLSYLSIRHIRNLKDSRSIRIVTAPCQNANPNFPAVGSLAS